MKVTKICGRFKSSWKGVRYFPLLSAKLNVVFARDYQACCGFHVWIWRRSRSLWPHHVATRGWKSRGENRPDMQLSSMNPKVDIVNNRWCRKRIDIFCTFGYDPFVILFDLCARLPVISILWHARFCYRRLHAIWHSRPSCFKGRCSIQFVSERIHKTSCSMREFHIWTGVHNKEW